jgi:hypothetical protein
MDGDFLLSQLAFDGEYDDVCPIERGQDLPAALPRQPEDDLEHIAVLGYN